MKLCFSQSSIQALSRLRIPKNNHHFTYIFSKQLTSMTFLQKYYTNTVKVSLIEQQKETNLWNKSSNVSINTQVLYFVVINVKLTTTFLRTKKMHYFPSENVPVKCYLFIYYYYSNFIHCTNSDFLIGRFVPRDTWV